MGWAQLESKPIIGGIGVEFALDNLLLLVATWARGVGTPWAALY